MFNFLGFEIMGDWIKNAHTKVTRILKTSGQRKKSGRWDVSWLQG
jgi:hypothetical protein